MKHPPFPFYSIIFLWSKKPLLYQFSSITLKRGKWGLVSDILWKIVDMLIICHVDKRTIESLKAYQFEEKFSDIQEYFFTEILKKIRAIVKIKEKSAGADTGKRLTLSKFPAFPILSNISWFFTTLPRFFITFPPFFTNIIFQGSQVRTLR